MAAFSSIYEQQQQHPFLLDSNSDPSNSINCNINTCALLDEPNNANFMSSSSTFYIQPQHLDRSTPPNNDSSSSSDHLIHTLTNNSTDSSSIVTHHYKYDHNLLTTTPIHNKRKSKPPSNSSNSAQSKDKREVKGKKQKKMKDNVGEEKNKSSQEEEEKAAAGYIHVRARRGQATDSHSLAERIRRERISERMKLLQGLVPGCDKVTGKALMLDEIINYVQSLQNQVEFLSMKLACVNPMSYDFGMDLESLMVRAHDHQPLPSMQESSPTTANNYHNLLQNSPHSILFPHETQISNVLPHLQGSRQGLWEVDEHRQLQRSIMNQSAGFTNTFFSFH